MATPATVYTTRLKFWWFEQTSLPGGLFRWTDEVAAVQIDSALSAQNPSTGTSPAGKVTIVESGSNVYASGTLTTSGSPTALHWTVAAYVDASMTTSDRSQHALLGTSDGDILRLQAVRDGTGYALRVTFNSVDNSNSLALSAYVSTGWHVVTIERSTSGVWTLYIDGSAVGNRSDWTTWDTSHLSSAILLDSDYRAEICSPCVALSTSNFSGADVTNIYNAVKLYVALPPVSATLSATLAASALSATASIPVKGSVSVTLVAATFAATASIPVQAQLTATLAPATLAATAAVPVVANMSATLGAATLAATAQALVKASVVGTLAPSTLAATAQAIMKGAVAATLLDSTLVATASIRVSAVLSVTLAPATLDAHGGEPLPPVSATIASTLTPSTLSATAQVTITAAVVATLQPAALAAGGAVIVSASIAATLLAATIEATAHVANDSLPARITFGLAHADVEIIFKEVHGMINVGDSVSKTVEIRNLISGEHFDPSGLAFYVERPDRTRETSITVAHVGLGLYRVSVRATSAGKWRIVAIVSGELTGREPTDFTAYATVADEAFPP